MRKILKRLRRDEKGFTLIELMVVIAIIGVLTALIIPRVLAAQNQAKINDTVNETRVIEAAIEQAYANSGSLPTTVTQDTTTGSAQWTKFVSEVSQYASLPADVQDVPSTGSVGTTTEDFNFVSWDTPTTDQGVLILTINDTNGGKDAVRLVTNDPNYSSGGVTGGPSAKSVYEIDTTSDYTGSSSNWTRVTTAAW